VQHRIPIEEIGPLAEPMAKAVDSCVHCGFCLPACPTYQVLGEEMDSPRGRIILMKEVLEGNLQLKEATPYLDPCLGCMACVTACPSGVQYGELITPFRALTEERRERSLADSALRRLMLETLPFPARFRVAAMAGRLARLFRKLAPGRLGAMLDLLPATLPKAKPLPAVHPAEGERRARVALLAGCAQRVLAPEINWATLRVLARNGIEVVIPRTQKCCGALPAHTGVPLQARAFAKHNLGAFPQDVDAILTNAAGCGSGMKEYPLWLKGEPEEDAAAAFATRVTDVSVFLADLGARTPGPLPEPLTVAYHDACHLAHGQGVTLQPRHLLAMVPNLELVEIPDGELCCGSAGTYNIEQPEIASELGRRKADAILASGAEAVATGNIGCLIQIQTHLKRQGQSLPLFHTMELLDLAYATSSAK
jgi:glycolate oxidase iron-sulfur subunit